MDENVQELLSLRKKLEQCRPLQDERVTSGAELKDNATITTDPELCTSGASDAESTDQINSDDKNPRAARSRSKTLSTSVDNEPSGNFVSQSSAVTATSSATVKYKVEKIKVINYDQTMQKIFYQPAVEAKQRISVNSLLGETVNKTKTKIVCARTMSSYGPTEQNKKQFIYPYQLANGPNNELFVSDRENHQLIIFDDKLQYLRVFGSKGSGKVKKGTFYNPTGLAVDAAGGALYVADHNNIIQKFELNGDMSLDYVGYYGKKEREKGQLLYPCGLAFSSKGLFVCDYGNHRIQVFKGSEVDSFGHHGSNIGEFKEPHSIVINKDENKVFVTDHSNNRIQVFTTEGSFVAVIVDKTNAPSNPQVQYPRGIFYTSDGHLLVSCTYTHCIVEFTEDGSYVSTIEGIVQPGGIVLQHTGDIVVTSNVKQVLYVIASLDDSVCKVSDE